jgi:CRP-like cAMP-binding protein
MLRPHDCIFRQGDPATAFFITISGWVKLYRITQAGEETVIHTMTKGDSFAEAVTPPPPRPSAMLASFASLQITSCAAFARARTSLWP